MNRAKRSRPIQRRTFVKGAAASLVAANAVLRGAPWVGATTLVQTPPSRDIRGTKLSLLQWSHFVPRYDQWFDQFLAEWAAENEVEARVDHINPVDVPATIAAEIGAGEGHDLFEFNSALPQFEPSVLDLTDLVEETTSRHGPQLEMAHRNSFNPTTGVYYGYCHGYAPDPGNYRQSLWQTVDLPVGPATWDELLAGGSRIKAEQGVQLGIGMSNEDDSSMAIQALLWAFGAAIQDEQERIVINSPETIAAIEYMKMLYEQAMTPEVFGWTPASNNQLLIGGQASYIVNSISAYRTAQTAQPEVAKDIFFTAPLTGSGGQERALAHGHAVFVSMIPAYSQAADTAKEFLLHLVSNYAEATSQSEFYTFPAWSETVPGLFASDGPLTNDPYGSEPADKLEPLSGAEAWTVNLGWPGPANAAIGEVFRTYVLSTMMAAAVRGEMTPPEAAADAEARITPIFEKWRQDGLIGGGS